MILGLIKSGLLICALALGAMIVFFLMVFVLGVVYVCLAKLFEKFENWIKGGRKT
mgnify:CR=1 FL=1